MPQAVRNTPGDVSGTADFVHPDSVVRRIWGNGDMLLLVFAGSAAEFALNRAVDWLFFTGKLPQDPIGRLFSTAGYTRDIVFANEDSASRTLARIRAIHRGVESKRGERIPDWAHRDVLYMLIDYSERAHEALARPLTAEEQDDLFQVFFRVGTGLGIPQLPLTHGEWRVDRDRHLHRDLVRSRGTDELYSQYRKQLGTWRYRLLLSIQSVLIPAYVRELLGLGRAGWLRLLLQSYPVLLRAGLRPVIHRLLMPSKYLSALRELDHGSRVSERFRHQLRQFEPELRGL